ncbi:DUF2271 domain-containing protein [Halopseudomonas pachastrellae]|nr:DUF2271 domain-containing protein [Halopseudomonas pachastrellae]
MKPHLAFALSALLGSSALQAAEAQLTVQIPRLDVAEYHRPYVAIWLENDAGHVADLTVWYDTQMRDDEGEKWLKDLRQWWRRSGRGLDMPIDGLSAATRPRAATSWRYKTCRPSRNWPPATMNWWLKRPAKSAAVNC